MTPVGRTVVLALIAALLLLALAAYDRFGLVALGSESATGALGGQGRGQVSQGGDELDSSEEDQDGRRGLRHGRGRGAGLGGTPV